MFDSFESGSDVHATFVASLMKLAMVQDPDGAEERKRPPKVAVRRGGAKLPDFEGVIESISTKYTMFLPDGTPVRATCRLAIREAGRLGVVKP
jgi:Contractile injection system tube protein